MISPVHFASCPEHGLHGRRDDCHECGGPVDQVAFVREADYHSLALRAQRLEAQRDILAELMVLVTR